MEQLDDLVIGFKYAWNTWNNIYDVSRTAEKEKYSDEKLVTSFEDLEKTAIEDLCEKKGVSKEEIAFTGTMLVGAQAGYYAAVGWNDIRTTKEEKGQFLKYKKIKSERNTNEQNEELDKEKEKGYVKFLDETNFVDCLDNKKYAIVDFYGVPCPPCKTFAPIYSDVAEEYRENVYFANLNAWEFPEISERHNIGGVPTIIFFEDGEIKDRNTGLMTKTELIDFVDKNIK